MSNCKETTCDGNQSAIRQGDDVRSGCLHKLECKWLHRITILMTFLTFCMLITSSVLIYMFFNKDQCNCAEKIYEIKEHIVNLTNLAYNNDSKIRLLEEDVGARIPFLINSTFNKSSKCEKGEKGEKGEQGTKGDNGDKGPQGPQEFKDHKGYKDQRVIKAIKETPVRHYLQKFCIKRCSVIAGLLLLIFRMNGKKYAICH